jgi:hypothetical protein
MFLRPDVHAVQLGEDVVLLDTAKGEYFCLVAAADAFDFQSPARTKITDEDLARDAREMGLIGAGDRAVVGWPPGASSAIVDDPSPRLRMEDIFDGLAGVATLARHYYGQPFGHLISRARQQKPVEAPSSPAEALVERVQAFRQLLPWAPAQGVCLYRSFFLLQFLRRRGFDATWMFGVKIWPFEAHCWLQSGDIVLDDSLDHVRPYTPILAV